MNNFVFDMIIGMQKEIEVKFLNIDEEDLISKLQKIGAKRITPKRLMHRAIFEIPAIKEQNNKESFAWIRLRDEGDVITLTYKKVKEQKSLNGIEEVLLEVSDFESARAFLEAIGMKEESQQENYRETWKYKNTFIEIDEWPHIPAFVELDGPSEDELKEVSALLDFTWQDAEFGNVDPIYEIYFDIKDGYEVTGLPVLNFETPLPKNIEAKRKG